MVNKSVPNRNPMDNTVEKAGLNKSSAMKVWTKTVTAACRLNLLTSLSRLDLGLDDVEEIAIEQAKKKHSAKSKDKRDLEMVKDLMKRKIVDAKENLREAKTEQIRMKKRIDEEYNKNSSKNRNFVRKLRTEAYNLRSEIKKKNETRIERLKKEKQKLEQEKLREVPEDLLKYRNLSIFGENYKENEENSETGIEILDEIEADEDEKAACRLPPKFAIVAKLKVEEFNEEQELCYTKLRWEIKKILEEDLGEDEEEKIEKLEEEKLIEEEEEAKSRQPFLHTEKKLDFRNRRVTDLKNNSRVQLPKPLPAKEEAKVEIRREAHEKVFKQYMNDCCDQKGNQSSNLTKSEARGLKKLKKRIELGEIVVMMTDKSGKFALVKMESYIRMGKFTHIRIQK